MSFECLRQNIFYKIDSGKGLLTALQQKQDPVRSFQSFFGNIFFSAKVHWGIVQLGIATNVPEEKCEHSNILNNVTVKKL